MTTANTETARSSDQSLTGTDFVTMLARSRSQLRTLRAFTLNYGKKVRKIDTGRIEAVEFLLGEIMEAEIKSHPSVRDSIKASLTEKPVSIKKRSDARVTLSMLVGSLAKLHTTHNDNSTKQVQTGSTQEAQYSSTEIQQMILRAITILRRVNFK